MPIVGNSDEDRAVAHYKQATRYDKENKPAKSRAHLRRALDYLSFGMHDQPYDLEKPAYVKPLIQNTRHLVTSRIPRRICPRSKRSMIENRLLTTRCAIRRYTRVSYTRW